MTGPIELEFLNVFVMYYNRENQKTGSMFTGIIDEDSTETNEMMEEFNDELEKFAFTENDEEYTTMYESIDKMGEYDELYRLKMGDHEWYCRRLVPLIYFLAGQTNWIDIVWTIKKLK
jgi:nitrate reductase assembly molybdenum cofactor insertion protein NarJ